MSTNALIGRERNSSLFPLAGIELAALLVVDRLCNNPKLPIIHATIHPIPIL
jgi:hypothetical protein